MPAELSLNVVELPESRVRVGVEVPPAEVERAIARTARDLGRDLRVPGFRQGKVPPPVVVRRLGRASVLEEALRRQVGEWYAAAIDQAGIAPVGDPDVQVGELPTDAGPVTFSIEIAVRPRARLGAYKGLEVGRREPEVADEDVDAELARLRERLARLETVERAAEKGDFVVADFVGSVDGQPFEGGQGRDQLIELGGARLVEGFEEQLVGARAGEERTVTVTFPQDYRAEELAGREAAFTVTVKEVKEKQLPELDDDFAAEAAGLDSLAELREDIAGRLRENQEQRVEAEFREAAVDAAVAQATIDVPRDLVHARAHEMWHETAHALEHQGISPQMYLEISGKSEEELVTESEPDAERALKREAVLAAVAEAEGIEPGDSDVLEALAPVAQQQNTTPKKALERLKSSGRLRAFKRDLALRKAAELLAESAKAVPVAQAQAREQLWTPGKEAPAEAPAGGQSGGTPRIWTPGSS